MLDFRNSTLCHDVKTETSSLPLLPRSHTSCRKLVTQGGPLTQHPLQLQGNKYLHYCGVTVNLQNHWEQAVNRIFYKYSHYSATHNGPHLSDRVARSNQSQSSFHLFRALFEMKAELRLVATGNEARCPGLVIEAQFIHTPNISRIYVR